MTREEAIKLIDTHTVCFYNEIDSPTLQALHMAIEALKGRPRGEWKPFDLTWGRNVYFCTACKESTEVPTVNGQPSYNYCPNCGADNRGEEE